MHIYPKHSFGPKKVVSLAQKNTWESCSSFFDVLPQKMLGKVEVLCLMRLLGKISGHGNTITTQYNSMAAGHTHNDQIMNLHVHALPTISGEAHPII